MAERCISDAPVHMGRGREWRIHQHDRGTHGWVEMIVDVGCVMPRNRDIGKQTGEQIRSRIGELVEHETALASSA